MHEVIPTRLFSYGSTNGQAHKLKHPKHPHLEGDISRPAHGVQRRPRRVRCRSVEHFEALCERVEERRLLVDGAVASGIAALSDAEDFFLFAEPLRAAALAFSRDPSAAAHAAAAPHPRLVGLGRGGQRHGLYPPAGVLPHGGAAALLAPLPYLFPTAASVMLCHRALYCRYAVQWLLKGGGGMAVTDLDVVKRQHPICLPALVLARTCRHVSQPPRLGTGLSGC